MTVTTAYENVPSTTAESVNIKPFARSSWARVADDTSNGVSYTDHCVLGENAQAPLTRHVEVRKASLYHPSTPKDVVAGRRYKVTINTTVKTEDSVSGLVTYMPAQFEVSIAVGGSTIPVPATALQLLLSTVAELYDSVTTGVPDGTVMGKLALGATDI